MKQILLKLNLIALVLVAAISANAYDFEVDGIYYTITSFTDYTCKVTRGDIPYEGKVEVPNSVIYKEKHLIVNEIDFNTFRGNSLLNEVILNENIKKIGHNAFEDCFSLSDIQLNENLVLIEESAFLNCTKLSKIILPNTVEKVGRYSFSGCSMLKEISLGSLKEIEDGFIRNCTSLNEIQLPRCLERIGSESFSGCSSLIEINIPPNVKSIERGAFNGCISLRKIIFESSKIPLDLSSYSLHYGGVDYGLFKDCPLEEIIIGRNLQFDANLYFGMGGEKNGDIKSETIYPPFAGKEPKKIVIKNETDTISHSLFYGVKLVGDLIIEDSDAPLKIGCTPYRQDDAISNGRWHTEHNFKWFLPTNIYIGRTIDVMDFIRYDEWGSPIYHRVPWYSVDNTNLISYKIGDKCQNGFPKVTDAAPLLKEICFGENIEVVPNKFCTNANSLSTLKFGDSLKKIENNAFEGCTSLKIIDLPDSLLEICDNAFKDCPIQELILPYYLNSISNAFSTCTLDTLMVRNPTPPSCTGFKSYVYSNTILKVPHASAEIFSSTSPWANFWNIEELPPVLPELITLNEEFITIMVNEKFQLQASILPIETSDKNINWTSLDDNLAKVSNNGLIEGVGVGKTTIIATCGEVFATCEVEVLPVLAESIMLNENEISISEKDTFQLVATISPDNVTDKSIEWVSLDEQIASVSNEGVIAGVSVGETDIIAFCGEVSATCKVKVLAEGGVGNILIDVDSQLSIYSVEGTLIKKECSKEELNLLPKGIYIIVSDNKRFKISI